MSGGDGSDEGQSGAGRTPSFRLRRPGGDVDPSRIVNAPGVVLVIAGTIVAAFALFAFAPDHVKNVILLTAALFPAKFMSGFAGNEGPLAMVSPLITSMFIHGGIGHLLLNTFFLLAFGTPIARRMNAEGALQSASAFASASMFLTFFLLSGVFGSLIYVALNPDSVIPVVGASGGVYGLLGGVVRFAFNRSTLFGPEDARLNSLMDRPVVGWTAFVLLTNNPVFATLISPMAGGGGIAWEAHIGGYFFGLLTYPFFDRAARGFR